MIGNNKLSGESRIIFWGELVKNTWYYLLLACVFPFSFTISLVVDADAIAKSIIAFPGGAAAIGLIVQFFRDNESHKRKLELQKNDHGFSLAFTSHMSEFLFKKHVGFCEEYINEIEKIDFIVVPGVDIQHELTDYIDSLCYIRQKHNIWLASDINDNLEGFEKGFYEICRLFNKVNSKKDLPAAEKKILLDEALTLLEGYIVNSEINDVENKIISKDKLVESVKDILHINDLYASRKSFFAAENSINK